MTTDPAGYGAVRLFRTVWVAKMCHVLITCTHAFVVPYSARQQNSLIQDLCIVMSVPTGTSTGDATYCTCGLESMRLHMETGQIQQCVLVKFSGPSISLLEPCRSQARTYHILVEYSRRRPVSSVLFSHSRRVSRFRATFDRRALASWMSIHQLVQNRIHHAMICIVRQAASAHARASLRNVNMSGEQKVRGTTGDAR